MSTTAYYLSHALPIVLLLATVFFLLGVALGWLAWGSYQRDATYLEQENEKLRRELNVQ